MSPDLQSTESTITGLVGEVVDVRYVVERYLGKGGMGEVYLVRATHLDGKKCVMKLPRLDRDRKDEVRQRWENEFALMNSLPLHPGVLGIIDKGTFKGLPYAIMGYADGGSLQDELEAAGGHRLSLGRVLGVAKSLAAALDFVHGKGIVHRDLKPSNVLLTSTRDAILADFGIAKRVDDPSADFTATGSRPGTPPYMAGDPDLSPAYDQYALGVVVHQCLQGELPRKRFTDPLRPLTVKGLPKGFAAAVVRALHPRPGQRYESCRAFVEHLEELQRRRRKWELALAASLATFLVVGSLLAYGGAVAPRDLVIRSQPAARVIAEDEQAVTPARFEEKTRARAFSVTAARPGYRPGTFDVTVPRLGFGPAAVGIQLEPLCASNPGPGEVRVNLDGAPVPWAEQLSTLPGIRVVGGGCASDVTLTASTATAALVDAQGRALGGALSLERDAAAVKPGVGRQLDAFRLQEELLALPSPESSVQVAVSKSPWNGDVSPAPAVGDFQVGQDPAHLYVRSERWPHVVVLAADAGGTWQILFPSEQNSVLVPGRWTPVGQLKIGQPAGRTLVVALGSESSLEPLLIQLGVPPLQIPLPEFPTFDASSQPTAAELVRGIAARLRTTAAWSRAQSILSITAAD